jgi:hypothetical protein
MPQDTPNPASARARTGSGSDCWAAISPRDSGKFPPRQAPVAARNGHARLRLVPPAPPPRPRPTVEVRISAARGREPVGRTRAMLLREADLERLIEAAERLERAS